MTVYLTKRYALNLNYLTDIVVVLRRYDDSTAPWGVHVVTIDFEAYPPITSRAVGLFSTVELLALADKNRIVMSWPFRAANDWGAVSPINWQAEKLLYQYIWTQVVPMEWHDLDLQLGTRVAYFVEWDVYDGSGYDDDGYDWADHLVHLEDFLEDGWKPFVPAVVA